MSRCDTCNTELVDHCLRCGAPQCCPVCCVTAHIEELEAITEKLNEALQLAQDSRHRRGEITDLEHEDYLDQVIGAALSLVHPAEEPKT